ncbi:MAG TPA: carbohydrate-binding domain-containing protein [Candidatus Thermoplasmatota archaeon]|nr:carbohydrate-binding domain-containing protein [Candidatus Thermoplasmatota archaeon]
MRSRALLVLALLLPTVLVAFATPASAATVRLAAFGDDGTTSNTQRNVDGSVADGSQGYVGLGDYYYWSAPSTWKTMFSPLTSKGSYLALGNHDDFAALSALFPGGQRTWSRDVNGVRFVAIDTESRMDVGSSQYDTVRSAACGAGGPTVLLMHKGWWLLSGATHPGSEFPGSASAMDVLVKDCGVDLVLAGHEHNYQRLARDGVPYVVVGTGGQSLYAVAGSPPGTVTTCGCYGRLLLDLSSAGIAATFKALDGSVKDAFTAAGSTTQPPPPPPPSIGWMRDAESFPTRTTGGVSTRSTFDGGKAWNLWSNGHIEQAANASRAAAELAVRALGEPLAGTYPVFTVSVGGVEKGRLTAAGSLATYVVPLGAVAAGAPVRVAFVNDARSSTEDRNLIVDTVDLRALSATPPPSPPSPSSWGPDAETFPTRSTGGVATRSDFDGGKGWNLWSNGYVEQGADAARSDAALTIRAVGQPLAGTYPTMVVSVGGVEKARVTVGGAVATHTVALDSVAAGAKVRVAFVNDARSSTEDRNLLLDTIALGNATAAPPAPPPSPFDATFRNVRGNAWWVEADVSAVGGVLAGVDARVGTGAWVALTKTSWGSWAKSLPAPAGSTVQFRARATDGSADVSEPYPWPP